MMREIIMFIIFVYRLSESIFELDKFREMMR